MQTEMNKLFAEGGVMQEGGTVDPVSGNEVPPGAMQEEVRDDIDAKLSEGEFVFPADVVRFYGLEKLMMLRDKAKKGLERMNEIGQMGNAEEVPDGEALFGGEDEMDDDAFSSEIDSIMSEDEGGEEREYAKGGDVRKYAPGGYVGGEENKQLYRDAPIKGFEMVPMTNDAGQTIYIPFINGVAQLSIPSGYKVKKADDVAKPEEEKPVETAPTTGGDGGGGGDSGPLGNVGGRGGIGFGPGFTIGDDGLAVANETTGKLGSVIGGMLGMTVLGPLGMYAGSKLGKSFVDESNVANQQAAMNFNVAVSDSTLAANNAGVETNAATTGPSGTGGSAANAASAAAAAAASQGPAAQGAAAQAAADAIVAGKSASEAAQAGADAAANVSMSEAVDNAPAQEAAAGWDAPSWDAGQPSYDSNSGSDTNSGSGDTSSTSGESNSDSQGDVSGDSGVWAKGGFVSKQKKTKTKPKGLAGRRK